MNKQNTRGEGFLFLITHANKHKEIKGVGEGPPNKNTHKLNKHTTHMGGERKMATTKQRGRWKDTKGKTHHTK